MFYSDELNPFYNEILQNGIDPYNILADEEMFVQLERPRETIDRDTLVALAFIRSIRNSVHIVGKGFIGSWEGPWRSGKSTSAITFSWLIDKTFEKNFENRIIHTPDNFTEYIAKVEKLYTYEHVIGTACVIDEAGNTMASHEWHSRWSITINKVLQSIGLYKPILSFVAPHKDNVNSGVRKLVNTHFTVKRNNPEFATIKPYELHYNSLAGKTWPRFPRINFLGERLILRSIRMKGIPSEIKMLYDQLEPLRKKNLVGDNIEALQEKEDVKEQNMDREKMVNQIVDNYGFYMLKNGSGLDVDIIRYQFTISNRFAKFILKMAEAKLMELNKISNEIKEVTEKPKYKAKMKRDIFTEEVHKRKIGGGNIFTSKAEDMDLELDE